MRARTRLFSDSSYPASRMDMVEMIGRLPLDALARSRVPDDLETVRRRADKATPRQARSSRRAIEEVWRCAEALYRSGTQPGLQLCVRRRGEVALHRSLGHARGNAPRQPAGERAVVMTPSTPVNAFSASKSVTAMLVHKLEEDGRLRLDDAVQDHIPAFGRRGKEAITIRQILTHRAGIPDLPDGGLDLDLLAQPERLLDLLCDLEPRSAPGAKPAYHAISGGFVLGEVIQRVTGGSVRDLAARTVREPLGLEWFHYGVDTADLERVARNASTGPLPPPPISWLLKRTLGTDLRELIQLSNDPRFLTAVVPSANLFTTAGDIARFYQCLLDGGELEGVRVFEEETVERALAAHGPPACDGNLILPMRYSPGFMLGSDTLSLYGWNHPRAFGHLGFSNVICWADPDRDLVVALLTTGKPVFSAHVVRLAQLIASIHDAFPPIGPRRTRKRARGASDSP
jgi:CubicO group peptidase (beta-lactamase class C family)